MSGAGRMRIAVIGAGGIGGMLAARLGAAGHEVAVLARGRHLAAIRERGLTLRAPEGETTVRPAVVSDRGTDLPEADLVIVAVKAQDLEGAMAEMAPAMAGGAPALPFLNGVEATERLEARFGKGRALIGIARMSGVILEPGVVGQMTPFASYIVGDASGRQSAAPVPAIRAAFAAAGIVAPDCPDVTLELWRKFCFLTAFSATTAGARVDIGTVLATPELRALFLAVGAEVVRLGRARGIALTEAMPQTFLDYCASPDMPPGTRASMAHDLGAGKPLEVDWLSGGVVRLAAGHGLEAPANAAVAAVLAPWKHGDPMARGAAAAAVP